MSWASHPTNEMPESLAHLGRHRRRRTSILAMIIAGGLLVLAVAGAMLSPTLLGWPQPPGPMSAAGPATPRSTSGAASTEDPAEQLAAPLSTPVPGYTTVTAGPPEPNVTSPARSATAVAVNTEFDTLADQVVTRTNDERTRNGCPAVRTDLRLTVAAVAHTTEMAFRQQLTHTGANGSDPGERIRGAGYDPAAGWAENVAAGYPTPEAVMTGWMKSKGHRENILNCSLKAIGVGVARAANGLFYWTQDFGGR